MEKIHNFYFLLLIKTSLKNIKVSYLNGSFSESNFIEENKKIFVVKSPAQTQLPHEQAKHTHTGSLLVLK